VSYDALNRPTGKTFSGGAGAPASCASTPGITYSYDSTANGNEGIGRRTGMSDGSGSSSWQYNALGQVTSGTKMVDGVDYTTGASMDAFGRPLTQSLPSGESLSFSYNAMGALTSLSGTTNYLTGANYNASGQVTDQQLGNGVTNQYCYDSSTLRLTKLRSYTDSLQSCVDTPSGIKLSISYSYQPNGNISQIEDDTKNETIFYTYDELDRLLAANGHDNNSYSYNKLGNIENNNSSSDYSAMTAGEGHTCAITLSGGVQCWGKNDRGQLGDGTTTLRNNPIDASGLSSGVVAIVAGNSHTCAITSAGGVKCWGYNNYGQLGDGTTTTRKTPVDVSGLTSGVVAITAGYSHSCAITSSGGVKCWGYNNYSQLGDGTTTTRKTPVDVSGLTSGVGAIAAGYSHTCALTSSGGVKCWGYNSSGQLGDGTTTTRPTPVDVSGLTNGIVTIATGDHFTCALTSTGGAKCWGMNSSGQLGDGTTTSRNTPVNVSGLTSGESSISAGSSHTCALTSSGVVKCWGRNASGQLGDGTLTSHNNPGDVSGLSMGAVSIETGKDYSCAISSIGDIRCWGDNTYSQLGDGKVTLHTSPVEVSGLSSGIVAVAVGYYHTCALTSSGGVKCWGSGGQIGDGTTTIRYTPVDVSGLTSGVTAIAAGFTHTCALTSSGGVKCWGDNTYGQLGDGTYTTRLTPVDVSGLTSGVVAIAGGVSHTCAVTSTGGVKCWGFNSLGQLGDGTTTSRRTPVDVIGLNNDLVAVTAGYFHTCALTSSGGIKCWGGNIYGQLGDGTVATWKTAVSVSGLSSGVVKVSAGYYHTCAMTSSGGSKCWGNNDIGQLGDGTLYTRYSPVNVNGLTSGTLWISAGLYYTCAGTTSGGAKCWGNNSSGQLGDGTYTNRSSPVDVNGLADTIVEINAGEYHTCAITTSGGINCWGDNSRGQLGNGELPYRTTPVTLGQAVNATYVDQNHKHAVSALSNGNSYAYDANGNMTERIESGVTYTQVFDAENHLVSVTANSQTTQFVYDGDGNLVKKINPDNTSTIYIGSVYEVQKDSGGTATGTTTYYPSAGAMRVNGTLYYVLRDRLGSASVVLNDSGGTVGETRYDPFGGTRETDGSLLTDRLFTGQREMAGLGLYHFGARFYSPGLGRFIQADTIVPDPGNPQSLNRFSYVNNNPIRYNDPSGHSPEGRCGGGGGCDKNAYVYVPPKKPSATPSITTPRADEDDEDDRSSPPYQPTTPPYVPPATPGVFLPTSTPELQLKPGPSRTPTPTNTSTPQPASVLAYQALKDISGEFSLVRYSPGWELGLDTQNVVLAAGGGLSLLIPEAAPVIIPATVIIVVGLSVIGTSFDIIPVGIEVYNKEYDKIEPTLIWLATNGPTASATLSATLSSTSTSTPNTTPTNPYSTPIVIIVTPSSSPTSPFSY
jgi:RHS repeat-associated protein